MLKHIHIQNIILVESALVDFQAGFNVITGETGSGKTAMLEALKLIHGARADTSILRKGTDKGIVEALFDPTEKALSLLVSAGIDFEEGEELIIRREIKSDGKSRAFINNQSVQISFLKQVAEELFEIIGQHASQKLMNCDNHRKIVDLYGDLVDQVKTYAASYTEEQKLQKELSHLETSEALRLRELETTEREINEIREVALKEGEDEELFNEYTRLMNTEESMSQLEHFCELLEGDGEVILRLSRSLNKFQDLTRIDNTLSKAYDSYKNSLLELQEVAHVMRNKKGRQEFNPARAESINERLILINKLKKKYGPTTEDVLLTYEKLLSRLKELMDSDQTKEVLKEKLYVLQKKNEQLAKELSLRRKSCAEKLERSLTCAIQKLNMPRAEIRIKVTDEPPSTKGIDFIEFHLSPNVGEGLIPLNECASGGEIARVLLAIETLLSEKEQIPTLIFDEVDANIGGKTAAIVGEQIRLISQHRQVLCITHFSQVAKCGHHHIRISKEEIEGRTLTKVLALDLSEKATELARMSGE